EGDGARLDAMNLAQRQAADEIGEIVADAPRGGAGGGVARLEVEDDGVEFAPLVDGALDLALNLLDRLVGDRIGHGDEEAVLETRVHFLGVPSPEPAHGADQDGEQDPEPRTNPGEHGKPPSEMASARSL